MLSVFPRNPAPGVLVYGSHPELWHPMGHLSSQSGVQQGDPLGPMLFALVLQKLISTIDAND